MTITCDVVDPGSGTVILEATDRLEDIPEVLLLPFLNLVLIKPTPNIIFKICLTSGVETYMGFFAPEQIKSVTVYQNSNARPIFILNNFHHTQPIESS